MDDYSVFFFGAIMKEFNYGHKPDMDRHTYKVDPDVVGLYADENCKECYGRGYLSTQIGVGRGGTIRKDRPIQEFIDRCSCTLKAMKKYG